MFQDAGIAPRWLLPAGSWILLRRSSSRCSQPPTILNIAPIYAEILAARGDSKAASEAEHAAAEYELLLARRPEAYADHAAAFFMGVGNRPERAVELPFANWKLATRHARAAFWPERGETPSRSRC